MTRTNNPPTKIAIVSRDHEAYRALYEENNLKNAELIYCSNTPTNDVYQHAEILLSEPDVAATFLHKCTSLKWLQSTWAGNNKLQYCSVRNYLLTGVKGIFSDKMKEYVFAVILSHYRELNALRDLQSNRRWQSLPGQSVRGLTLGVLGFGSIAKALVSAAEVFGLNIIGLTTNGGMHGTTYCYASTEKLAFARKCDIVLNLLPDTASTRGFCDSTFFQHMRSNGLFINAGRGSIIDSPQTLIDALEKNELGAAVLDVFTEEPLPSAHPFYKEANIVITNHSAAVSDPSDVFAVFLANYQKYLDNQTLLYVHDFDKGY